MPRPWTEYSKREWLRLRPIVERYKQARYQAVVAMQVRRAPAVGKLGQLRAQVANQQLLVTVAFNDPSFVAAQTALVSRQAPGCVHLVADNSSDDRAAAEIEAVARDRGCAYLRLKRGPWRGAMNASRSHALAMNWVWRNVIRPGRPSAFGFLDHDIFPMRPSDPFAPLATHKVSGLVKNKSGRERWHLWAGFCFFRFDAVERLPLDFSLDWAAGLDTGGRNWFALYRQLAPADVHDAGLICEPIDPHVPAAAVDADVPSEIARFEWIGDWLHASNFSTTLDMPADEREALQQRKRAILDQRLAEVLSKKASSAA